jgi:hypothetical protein
MVRPLIGAARGVVVSQSRRCPDHVVGSPDEGAAAGGQSRLSKPDSVSPTQIRLRLVASRTSRPNVRRLPRKSASWTFLVLWSSP